LPVSCRHVEAVLVVSLLVALGHTLSVS
jgi:hypothetical protein